MVLLLFTGVPLPLIGMFAYGLVSLLGIQLAGKHLPFKKDENNGLLILLGSATSMAVASAYFLYIQITKFPGSSCSYCFMSALLSFSLFFTTIKVLLTFCKFILLLAYQQINICDFHITTKPISSLVGCITGFWVARNTKSGRFTAMLRWIGGCYFKHLI